MCTNRMLDEKIRPAVYAARILTHCEMPAVPARCNVFTTFLLMGRHRTPCMMDEAVLSMGE
jgi:hypothetical protein